MSPRDHYRNYEKRQQAKGYVRKGVRLPGDAAAQLEQLAWRNRMTEAEVIARLLLGIPLASHDPANPYGLSESELAFVRAQGLAS